MFWVDWPRTYQFFYMPRRGKGNPASRSNKARWRRELARMAGFRFGGSWRCSAAPNGGLLLQPEELGQVEDAREVEQEALFVCWQRRGLGASGRKCRHYLRYSCRWAAVEAQWEALKSPVPPSCKHVGEGCPMAFLPLVQGTSEAGHTIFPLSIFHV